MKKAYANSLFLFLALLLGLSVQAGESPIVGNLKVVSAQCGGDKFLWKKSDEIILTGELLVLGGNFEKEDQSADEACRVQDIYKRVQDSLKLTSAGAHEDARLIPVKRRVTCWKVGDVKSMNNPDVSEEEIIAPLEEISLHQFEKRVTASLEESELCQTRVELELSHY